MSAMNNMTMLDFGSAMAAARDGAKVSKIEWKNEEVYGMLRDGTLQFVKDGVWHQWIVNDGDLRGDDWFIVASQ